MAEITRLRNAVFEDLASSIESWTSTVCSAVSDPDQEVWVEDADAARRLRQTLGVNEIDDLRSLVGDAMRGLIHSVLVTIDGGAASAEVGRVALVNEANESLGEGLHELFSEYLYDTGRLS